MFDVLKRVQIAAVLILVQVAVPCFALNQGYTNFKGSTTFNGAMSLVSTTTIQISTTANDFDWGTHPIVLSSASRDVDLTGFANAGAGKYFSLYNVSTNTISILNLSTFSSSGNQIETDTGTAVTLGSGDSRSFWYDGVSLLWRILK